MKHPYFLAYCLRTPWAMDPVAMQTYAAILVNAYTGRAGVEPRADIEDEAGAGRSIKAARGEAKRAGDGAIALINVHGAIVQRASQLGPCEGGTGAQEIGNALSAAVADPAVSQVLMNFDTPGGSVFGTSELGDKIRAARAVKPVIGIADSMAASAGYWLLSQCSEAYVTPGGMVGSIGVYTAHEDVSKALEAKGVNITLVSAGKYKVEGNPFEPLSDEARADTQARVDTYYRAFVHAVAKGRGVSVDQVRNGMGEGRVLLADDALKAGMVDGVMSFDDLVAKMQRGSKQRSARAAAFAQAQADIAGLA